HNLVVSAANVPAGLVALTADPKLDPNGPRPNGGPTSTVALLSGSPAIDAASSAALSTDQRGQVRDAHPDLGAYEFVVLVPTLSIADVTQYRNGTDHNATGGDTVFVFAVTLSSVPYPVTVSYQTTDGAAVAGTDYLATDGTLQFTPDGPATQTIGVLVHRSP